jgi:mannitol-specific phosphotransferase system IIBC component
MYFFFWPLCCLFFCLLAFVLSVLLLQTKQWPKDRRTDKAMAKRQKNRQSNGQKTEEQTKQWPKDRRTDIALSVLLSFGHCFVCSSSTYGF